MQQQNPDNAKGHNMQEYITSAVLKELVDANSVRTAFVVGEHGGFVVIVRYGMKERVVAARSSAHEIRKRTFKNLDSVDKFLRETVHIPNYTVDSANFEKALKQPRALQASQRLKKIHANNAYAVWLDKELQESIDDPSPPVEHAEAMRQMRAAISSVKPKSTKKEKTRVAG